MFYLILFTVFLFRLLVKHVDAFKCSVIIYQYTKLEAGENPDDVYFLYLIYTQSILYLLLEGLKLVWFLFRFGGVFFCFFL